MAVIFAFNELDGCTSVSGTAKVRASATAAIANVARAGILVDAANEFAQRIFADTTTGWLHFRHQTVSNYSIGATVSQVELFDNSNNSLFRIQEIGGATFQVVILGTVVYTTSSGVATRTFDVNFNIADTGGYITVYMDGVQVAQTTGDTRPATSGAVRLRFQGRGYYLGGPAGEVHIGQVLLSDKSTIGALVHTLPVTAFGSTNAWSGAYTNVNETNVDTANVITANTNGQDVLFAIGDLGQALQSGNAISAVVISQFSSYATGSAVTKLLSRLRSSAATYSGSQVNLTTTFASYQHVFATDPATGTAWTVAGVNAAEIGMQAVT